MGLTFSIGATTFNALTSGNGRFAIDINPGAENQRLIRYHAPGVNGNYVCRAGRKSQRITVRMRYKGTLANALALANADRAAVQNTAVDIMDADGVTPYQGCNLVEDGWKRVTKITGVPLDDGSSGVYFEVEATFTRDR